MLACSAFMVCVGSLLPQREAFCPCNNQLQASASCAASAAGPGGSPSSAVSSSSLCQEGRCWQSELQGGRHGTAACARRVGAGRADCKEAGPGATGAWGS